MATKTSFLQTEERFGKWNLTWQRKKGSKEEREGERERETRNVSRLKKVERENDGLVDRAFEGSKLSVNEGYRRDKLEGKEFARRR